MGFRITTNMMLNTYKFNLQNTTQKLSTTRDQVMTQRRFSSYAEDPAAATLAFRLRRNFCQTSSYLSNTKDVYSKFNVAWNNLTGVVEDLSDATARVASIRGNNGTAGESRTALAIVLRETANSVVQSLNQKYGDHFVFAGNDALNAPFSWSDDGTILYYRGVDVTSGKVQLPTANDPEWLKELDAIKAGMQANKLINNPDTTGTAIKNWYDAVKAGNAPGTVTDTTLTKWLDQFAADSVKNGEMTDKEAAAWLDYYKGATNVKPTDDKGNTLKEPGWAEQIANVSEWDEAEADQMWYNYYMGITDTAPDETKYTEPGWFDTLATAAEQKIEDDPDLSDAEKTEQKRIIQEWLAYYKKEEGAEPPVLEQSEEVQGWGTVDEANGELFPAGLPEKMEDDWDGATKAWYTYYDDKRELDKLNRMANEEMYIDLGMGAEESSPNVPVRGTYFNSALCGVSFLGYGADEDGDPLSLPNIMKELADVFETWDEDTQSYNPALAKNSAEGLTSGELEAKAYRLMDKLKAAQEHTTEKWVELDAQSVYLTTTESRLTIQQTDLNMQILDVEQIDLAEAITNFSWQQYCYNAALKIGNQLLSQSLIDYMS